MQAVGNRDDGGAGCDIERFELECGGCDRERARREVLKVAWQVEMKPAVGEQMTLPAAPVGQRDRDQAAGNEQRACAPQRIERLGYVLQGVREGDQLEALRWPGLVVQRPEVDARTSSRGGCDSRLGRVDAEGLPAERRVVRQ